MRPRVLIIQYTIAVQLTRLRGGVNAMWSGCTDQYFICKGGVLSCLSRSVVYLPLSWKVSPRFGYLRQRNCIYFLFFCSFKCRMTFDWSFLFLLLCAIPHSSFKMLKCFKMPHQWEHTCLISWKNNLQMCSFSATLILFFSRVLKNYLRPVFTPHMKWIKDLRISSRVK